MNAITIFHPGIVQRSDWRKGFMTAIEQRLQLEAPPSMTEAEIARRCAESQPFGKGYREGMLCALACSHSQPDYQQQDQHTIAAWIAGAACLVATGILYATSI